MNLIGTGLAWLNERRVESMADDVTYSRGVHSVTLSASTGSTTYDVADDSGVTVRAIATDFIIAAADLILNSVEALPEPGDTITATLNGNERTFEVLDLAGMHCWRYSDPHQVMLRVHAKEVAE